MSLIKANAHQVGDYTLTNEGGKLVINQGTPDTVLNPVGTFGLNGLEIAPVGGVAATTVQMAIAELDSEKVSTANLAASSGSSLVGYLPSGTGAIATTLKKWMDKDAISVFGAMTEAQIYDVQSTNPTIDVTLALNTAAAAARTLGKALKLPEVKSHYPISGTVDFSGIRFIDGRGALLKGAISGIPAAVIGDNIADGSIWLEVRNSADKSNIDGTMGIKVLGMNRMKCWVFSRGFEDGLHFDGASADRSWVSNEFNIIGLYNNGSQIHFNLDGASYAVANQFRGGAYYLGTNQIKSGRGTVKATLKGASLLSEIVFDAPQIGIDGGSRDADHGMYVYAECSTTSSGNTISFRDSRLELYGSSSFTPHYVNIPITTSGSMGIDIDALAMPIVGCQINIGASKTHNVTLNYTGVPGSNQTLDLNSNLRPTFPYQVNGRVYVPERIIYNANYLSPAQYISDGVGVAGANRAIGDGKFLSASTAVAVGTKWKKTVGRSLFLKMSGYGQLVVICYDAAGNTLSGESPWYCSMRGVRSILSAGANVYQGQSDWVFIHPDVDSFFIGWCAWSGPDFYADLQFDVLMGPGITRIRDDETGPNMVAFSSSIQSYMQVGMAMDAATAAYRNELLLKTTTTASSASGTNTITVADATGINTNCQLGVELDTVVIGSERRYQHCAITAVAGNAITISPALTANVAAGRRVLVNKWSIR